MTKRRMMIAANTLLLILNFMPWLSSGGHSYTIIGLTIRGFSGGYEPRGLSIAIGVIGIIAIASFSVYAICLMRSFENRVTRLMSSAVLYVGTVGTFTLYVLYEVLFLMVGTGGVRPTLWILFAIVINIVASAAFKWMPDDPEETRSIVKNMSFSESQYPEECKSIVWRALFALLSASFILNFVFGKWLVLEGTSFTLFEYFKAVLHYGGLRKLVGSLTNMSAGEVVSSPEYVGILPACGALYLVLAAGIIALIRIVFILIGKKHFALGMAVDALYAMQLVAFVIFGGYDYKYGILVSGGIAITDFLLIQYLRQKSDMIQRMKDARKRAEARKEEKRRRTFFPGKYSREFYQVVAKNAMYNRRSYVMFLAGAAGVVIVLSITIGIYVGLGSNPFKAYLGKGMNYGDNMLSVVKDILPMIAFFSVLILALIITHYIRTRMANYSAFNAVGIRQDTLKKIITIEYLTCTFIALVLGLVVGGILLEIIVKTIYTGSIGTTWHGNKPVTMLITTGAYLVLLLIATLINYHMFEYTNIMKLAPKDEDEKIAGGPISLWVRVVVGALFVIYGLYEFASPEKAEGFTSIIIILIGAYLLINGIAALIIRERAKKDEGKKLLGFLSWRYRFKSNTRFWYLLFAFQVLILATYLPGIAEGWSIKDADSNYPYDYVCMARESDNGTFEEIEQNGGKVDSYQMLRVTTPLGAPFTFNQTMTNAYMSVLWPQGQHIAISESSYKKILGKKNNNAVNLKGKQIKIIYQQEISDKAHPLEYYSAGENMFRLGQPLDDYLYGSRDRLYPAHTGANEKREIVTGIFGNGSQENIVVLSDEYFDEMYSKTTEGPKELKLIKNSPSQNKTEKSNVSQALQKFAYKNKGDSIWDESIKPYYSKVESANRLTERRTLQQSTYFLVIAGMLLCTMFVFFIKNGLEEGERNEKYYMFKCLGMPYRERKKRLKREMNFFIHGSNIAAIITAIPLFLISARLRQFSSAEFKTVGFNLIVAVAINEIIYYTALIILRKYFTVKTIGKVKGRISK